MKAGKGKLTYANGDCYKGYFVAGEIEGSGVLHFQSGSTYTGMFKKGKQHGEGTFNQITSGLKGITYNGKF